jgi:hypothetical protein
MYFEKIGYTTITGKMEKAMAAYTCPILNFRKSAEITQLFILYLRLLGNYSITGTRNIA